jgi:Calreticulin family
MFGPDKCGATDKVHFILQHRNPVSGMTTCHHTTRINLHMLTSLGTALKPLYGQCKSTATKLVHIAVLLPITLHSCTDVVACSILCLNAGVWEEKHLADAPRIRGDKKHHVYTLALRPSDGSYEIYIDTKSESKGSLLDAMTPPINVSAQQLAFLPVDTYTAASVLFHACSCCHVAAHQTALVSYLAVYATTIFVMLLCCYCSGKQFELTLALCYYCCIMHGNTQPPEMIDDPTDHKPADWVDEAMIADPAATKPEGTCLNSFS